VVENHDNPDFPMAWEVLRYVWRLGKAKWDFLLLDRPSVLC
jgi:hypothetical protein